MSAILQVRTYARSKKMNRRIAIVLGSILGLTLLSISSKPTTANAAPIASAGGGPIPLCPPTAPNCDPSNPPVKSPPHSK
jgi:hypothetical protein